MVNNKKLVNDEVPEKFAFLHVGQWTKGDFGEDRKDIGRLIKVFYESFANKKRQPALILKVNGATFSVIDKELTTDRIKAVKDMFPKDWKLPNVYLLHGDLNKQEMNYLYNHPKVKAMVSFTHGEGFGRPLLEASMVGLPVIASGWSGQVDFLDKEQSIYIAGSLGQVPKSAVWQDIIIPESQWFTIDENEAYKALNHFYSNSESYKNGAKTLMNKNRKKYTIKNMSSLFLSLIERYTNQVGDQPQEVALNLPKLKKINKSKSSDTKTAVPEIKLPKLKKVDVVEGVSNE